MTSNEQQEPEESKNNNRNNNSNEKPIVKLNAGSNAKFLSLENGSDNESLSSTSFNLRKFYSDKNVVFYCPSMESVARDIAAAANGRVILGKIEWNRFADGFPNILIRDAWHIRWQNVTFLSDLSNPRNIFEQYSLMSCLPRMLARSVKIFVAYFPTGTMERVIDYGQIATASTLSRMLSSIPHGAHGPVQICICDIHALQNHFYFSDNILVRLETCIPLLKAQLKKMKLKKMKVSVGFPDEGAHKRFGRFFRKYPQIICTKVRGPNDERKVAHKEGEVCGRDIVIVDDLVQSGGTLARCAQLFQSMKSASIRCYCTHAVFPNDSWKRFCAGGESENLFETFWVTDTIPITCDKLRNRSPFEVLSTASIFLPVINDDAIQE